jgi:ribose transport system permease protein
MPRRDRLKGVFGRPANTPPEGADRSPGSIEPGARRGGSRLNVIDLIERYGLVVIWGAVVLAFSIAEPTTFFTSANFETIFGTQSVQLVITLGLLIPLTVGELDLSVASIMAFSATMLAWLSVNEGLPLGAAIVVTLVAGLLVGVVNAALVVKVGVPSLIATLGMGTLLTGIGYGISNSETIAGISLTPLINAMTYTPLLGLPVAFYIGLFGCVVAWYVLDFTPLGRHMLFVGEGRDVARLAGLRVGGMRGASFLVSAVVCTIAGIMQAGVVGAADPGQGPSYLLPALAGAFLGQTAIKPGRFNPWGTFVAVYFLVTGITGLELLGAQGWVQDTFYGGSLIIAVSIARLVVRRRE